MTGHHERRLASDERAIAYVDESMRQRAVAGHFFLAVVRVPDAVIGLDRRLSAHLLLRQQRWHWRNERRVRRDQMIDTLAELHADGVISTVVHVHSVPRRRQRRARVVALWTALEHCAEWGVGRLVIESRQDHLDDDDRREIERARRSGTFAKIPYTHELPSKTPGLWLADAAAGAVGAHLADGVSRWTARLPEAAWDVVTVPCA